MSSGEQDHDSATESTRVIRPQRQNSAAADRSPDGDMLVRRAQADRLLLSPLDAYRLQRMVGNRAVSTTLARPAVQRLQVTEAPEDGTIYSRSDNGNMVTGMGSPNHEFYVRDAEAFPVMNGYIANSPMELAKRGDKKLFGMNMLKVGLSYKTKRWPNEAQRKLQKRGQEPGLGEQDQRENLQKKYEQHILPNIRRYRERLETRGRKDIKTQGLSRELINQLQEALHQVVTSLKLFKKVLTAELANTGAFSGQVEQEAKQALTLIAPLEHLLYSDDLTKAHLEEIYAGNRETAIMGLSSRSHRIAKLVGNLQEHLGQLIKVFPPDGQVNMMPFHRYQFNREMLENLYSPDNIALYRACDVNASTLLGNRVMKGGEYQLKNYNANAESAFHYATKVLKSGADWVSLEHFASSDRERDISGIGPDAKYKNLDHTWQFIMQGEISTDDEGVSPEDKYFEVYTKIRYYLTGLVQHEKGGFDTSRRDRAKGDVINQFVQVADGSQLSNIQGWRAFYQEIAGKEKEVELIDLLAEIDKDLYTWGDPLLHALASWDDLMKTIK